jgi:hypothetical protein
MTSTGLGAMPPCHMRSFSLGTSSSGGMSGELELEAFCYGSLEPTLHDHDGLAHALNERFSELGRNHPVPYSTAPGGLDS